MQPSTLLTQARYLFAFQFNPMPHAALYLLSRMRICSRFAFSHVEPRELASAQVLLREGAGLELVDVSRLERWGVNYIQRIKPKLSNEGPAGKAGQKGRVPGHLIGGLPFSVEEDPSKHSTTTEAADT